VDQDNTDPRLPRVSNLLLRHAAEAAAGIGTEAGVGDEHGSATQKLHFAKKDGGSLWRSVVSLTDDRDCKASWIIMALVLERVRAITRFFLKTSADTFQGTAGCSLAVFDYCNEHFSVVVETMQYTRSSKVQDVDS
jgi:hypothetical protein